MADDPSDPLMTPGDVEAELAYLTRGGQLPVARELVKQQGLLRLMCDHLQLGTPTNPVARLHIADSLASVLVDLVSTARRGALAHGAKYGPSLRKEPYVTFCAVAAVGELLGLTDEAELRQRLGQIRLLSAYEQQYAKMKAERSIKEARQVRAAVWLYGTLTKSNDKLSVRSARNNEKQLITTFHARLIGHIKLRADGLIPELQGPSGANKEPYDAQPAAGRTAAIPISTQPATQRWSHVEVDWMIDHLSVQQDWELTEDDYKACREASRSWTVRSTSNRVTRLRVLQKTLLSFLRARVDRANREKVARRRALRRVANLMQGQATQPMSSWEKLQCYITLRDLSVDELSRIAVTPSLQRELGAQVRALVDERKRDSYKQLRYRVGAHITHHYIEHGLGRSLGKGEHKIAETIIEKASEERIPYDVLLERLGRALGLDKAAMATARHFFVAEDFNATLGTFEEKLRATYKDGLPEGEYTFYMEPVESPPHRSTGSPPAT